MSSRRETQGEEASQEAERVLASHYGVICSEELSATGLAESAGARPEAHVLEPPKRLRVGKAYKTRDELYAEAKRRRAALALRPKDVRGLCSI